MTKGRIFALSAVVLAAMVGFGASAHAAAGPVHEAADCIACSLCDWLNSVFGH